MLNKINTEALRDGPFRYNNNSQIWKIINSEQIVLVITASKHRKEAIESCHFIIDW